MIFWDKVEIQDVQYDTDVAVAQDRTTADPGIFDVEIVQVSRKRFYNNLLFSKQLIYEQTVRFVALLYPDQNTVFDIRDVCFDIV